MWPGCCRGGYRSRTGKVKFPSLPSSMPGTRWRRVSIRARATEAAKPFGFLGCGPDPEHDPRDRILKPSAGDDAEVTKPPPHDDSGDHQTHKDRSFGPVSPPGRKDAAERDLDALHHRGRKVAARGLTATARAKRRTVPGYSPSRADTPDIPDFSTFRGHHIYWPSA